MIKDFGRLNENFEKFYNLQTNNSMTGVLLGIFKL